MQVSIKLKRYIGLVLILLHFSLEFFVKLFIYLGLDVDPGNTCLVYLKLLIFAGLILFSIYNFKSHKRLLLSLGIVCLLAMVGWLTYMQSFSLYELYIQIKTLSRYCYPFLWLIFFSTLSSYQIESSITGYRLILVINTILILIGIVFKVDLFNSYSNRFGYDGVFYLANDASAFYFIGLVVLYYRVIKNKEWKSVLEFVLVIIGSLLLGTKTAFLFLFLFSIYHVYTTKKYKHGIVIMGVLLLLAIVSGMLGFFIDLAQKTDMLTSILSLRNELFMNRFLPLIESWHKFNYLFGGANYLESYIQMDIVDVLILFGIVGGIFYLFIFFEEFFYKQGNSYLLFVGCAYIVLGALAGHFYPSGVVAIYLALTSIYLKLNCFESSTGTRLAH